ncbi:MAG TPA: hypothetical protein VGI39_28350 [Polyangiaceae bacterium]
MLAAAGCQAIAKLETRTVDPPPGAGCRLPGVKLNDGTGLPATGNGRVRLVNLATTTTNADLCVRVSGTTDWGRPILREGGTDSFCGAGLAYTQATVPFSVPVGKLDFKIIAAGQACTADKTSEVDGVDIVDSTPTTAVYATSLVRFAGAGPGTEQLAALPDDAGPQNPGADRLRFVNALNGGKNIDIGTPASPALPTTVDQPALFVGIQPGHAQPPGNSQFGIVDAEGYLSTLNSIANFAASFSDDDAHKALFVQASTANPDTATIYAFGDSSDNTHPVRGMYCSDRVSLASKVGADAGAGAGSNDTQLLQSCTLTKLPTISVDAWDVGLYGPNAPYPGDRRSAVQQAIAARQSDLFCIVEADDKSSDRDPIIQAALTQYPYSYEIDTTPTTPPDDPTTASGATPSPLGSPPCAGTVAPSLVSAAYGCLDAKCSTVSGGDSMGMGTLLGSTNCISQSCLAPFSRLYSQVTATPDEVANDGCFDCILLHVTSGLETFASGQDACTQDSQQPFVYGGQMPILMLSHYPLVAGSTKAYVLPSYGFRRGVLKAQVQLEDQVVDFFCAMMMSPQVDTELPYIGPYGQDVQSDAGTQIENGWEDQQALQAKRATAWIKQEADNDKLPAIIAGNWYSTISTSGDAGADSLGTISPEVMQTVDQSANPQAPFTRAEPPGYDRVCDSCPDNPYKAGGTAFEFMPLFLYDFPSNSTAAEALWGTDPTAVHIVGSTYQPPPTSGTGPLSEYYPHNTQVLRPK